MSGKKEFVEPVLVKYEEKLDQVTGNNGLGSTDPAITQNTVKQNNGKHNGWYK